MLLSIVECSHYKLWEDGFRFPIKAIQQCGDVEIIGPVLGPNIASMRNEGARAAQGDWLFFKDEDCKVDAGLILKVLKETSLIETNIAAIGGVYVCKADSLLEKCYSHIQDKWVSVGLVKKISGQTYSANHLLGGAYLVKKNIFIMANGFNEKIGWGGEESELTERLQKMGYQTVVNYDLKVQHKNNIKIFGFIKRAWHQNFHKGKFKISFEKRRSSFRYLTKKKNLLFPTLFYFSIAFAAIGLGRSVRLLSQIKKL